MTKKLTTQEFVDRSNKIHNNRYNYSKVNYINAHVKVIIICLLHGGFTQTPNSHLGGSGCNKCACKKTANNQRTTNRQFIKKSKQIHGNKYDYSKCKYINNRTKVILICPIHREFKIIPNEHLSKKRKRGCQKCSIENLSRRFSMSTQDFIKRAKQLHSNKYNYSKTVYKNAHTKVIIICPKHGEFSTSPNSHLYGLSKCPSCAHTISEKEIKWLDKIEQKENISIKRNITIHIGDKYFYPDGFHKSTNTWYEYNGYYWHGHPDHYDQSDIHPIAKISYGELYQKTLEKEDLIKSAGYNLVTTWGR